MDTLEIKLGRHFGAEHIVEFRSEYISLLKENVQAIVLDFEITESIDSSGIGMLLSLRAHFDNRPKIYLKNCQSSVARVFAINHLEKVFIIETVRG